MEVFKNNVSLEATPTSDTHVVNKEYVDNTIEQEIASIRVVGGITKTLLYEGSMGSAGTYDLNDSVFNYNLIIVEHEYAENQTCRQAQPICTISTSRNSAHFACYGYGSSDSYIYYYFSTDGQKVIVPELKKERIAKIYGIN